MPVLNAEEILKVTGADALNVSGSESFEHFEFDTRNISKRGTLFFALGSGGNDGHQFVNGLEKFEGVGAVVNRKFDKKGITFPLFIVNDPLKAAHKLASMVRRQYRGIRYAGITGSAGKTTTKEFLAQILSSRYKVFRSFRNWNNWIGMPFSILNMKGDEEFAVFELAMSYPGIGEIDLLADILRPDLAMILNVFPAHMEFLKTLKNVARGKAEILNYMTSDGVSFISGDSEHIKEEVKQKRGRKIFFGRSEGGNDIILRNVERTGSGSSFFIDFYGIEERFETNLVNAVQIENLFAAMIAAGHLGMKHFEIAEAVKDIDLVDGRGGIERSGDLTIIDETYNSNPVALSKTLEWVDREFRGSKIAVLGDMLELGEEEDRYHLEAGRFFSSLNFNMLITVGKRSEMIAKGAKAGGFPDGSIRTFTDSEEAGEFIRKNLSGESAILFKASRGIRLENAIRKIRNEK